MQVALPVIFLISLDLFNILLYITFLIFKFLLLFPPFFAPGIEEGSNRETPARTGRRNVLFLCLMFF
jgi:hypothetical protein